MTILKIKDQNIVVENITSFSDVKKDTQWGPNVKKGRYCFTLNKFNFYFDTREKANKAFNSLKKLVEHTSTTKE